MNLTNKEYQRLIGYAFVICKDHSRKKDCVHEGYLRMVKYCKIEPETEEEKLHLLMFYIKQAFYVWKAKWDTKNIQYFDSMHGFANKRVDDTGFPPMETPSRTQLEAIRKMISANKYKHLKNENKRFRQLLVSLKKEDYEAESVNGRGNIAEPTMGNQR